MTIKRNVFDKISEGIDSHAAVITAQFLAMLGMLLGSHALYGSVLPSYMNWLGIMVASWVLAAAWESIVLITTYNAHLFKDDGKWIPGFMALCSGVMMLFFMDIADPDLSMYERFQRVFVAILTTFTNKVLAHISFKKWQERKSKLYGPEKEAQLESDLAQAESRATQAESKLTQVEPELVQLRAFKAIYDEQRTCPHCTKMFETPVSMHVHKGKCPRKGEKLDIMPVSVQNLDKVIAPVQVAPLKLNGKHRAFEGA